MKSSVIALLATSVALTFLPQAAMAAPKVVASIKPVHSLVAAIMEGVETPELIVEGAASPHTYTLRPSDARKLQDANVVFWVGHGLEAFLEKPLEALSSDAKVVELEDAPGLEVLPFREGGAFEAHDHGDHDHAHEGEEAGHDDHDHAAESAEEAHAHEHEDEDQEHAHEEAGNDREHGGNDMHMWLDPMNAKAMASEIARVLEEADPENAATYAKNAEALLASLDALDKEIAETVAPIKDKPFVVFHDAYQYFEHRYGVRVAGSITVSPEVMPGADRVSQIHAKIKELNAACVFAEPQFEPKLIAVVMEGTDSKSGVLDPEAGTLTAGPQLYPDMMRAIATSLKDCLSD
ncbi:zinc ABC transporter substrate-binding protein ZnuA [Ciceribacter sp. L1K23]|uniref:zinc ABC transporter substrate-binding protein ZnuA n=1 Tax=Ciceribacter sp. L1K23 TaxID=2820276 RepID=UPI001B80FD0F|nr:zinc ABC transporter substrate-binding protein ZnuA [Ciceribacter sp. L1K23]MBR0555702.1 zinc ABC transporter substrate-binding protein ZnuA [Ciceribacter sp. L1K23]